MRRQYLFLITMVILMLGFSTLLSGCGASQPSAPYGEATGSTAATGTSVTASTPAAQAPEQKTFTIDELAQYNGKNGNPAYIAIEGTVYDVTNVSQWKNGIHVGKFEAGKDFTNELKNLAPHDDSKLQGVPVVGKLAD